MTDSTKRFSDRARAYVAARPSYPADAIEATLEGVGAPETLRAADVGAGTGISARLLADRGVKVQAVEPNAAMRQAAAPHPSIGWVDGTAEATSLPDASVALVLCAQAFHWFDAPRASQEFHRILRSGGRLALMWYEPDLSTPVALGYFRALEAVALDDTRDRRVAIGLNPGVRPIFPAPRLYRFATQQVLTREGLAARALSASYVPKTGPGAERLLADLSAVFDANAGPDGTVTLIYEVLLHLTERPARAGSADTST
jgi:SAM-dependent methyltransferase